MISPETVKRMLNDFNSFNPRIASPFNASYLNNVLMGQNPLMLEEMYLHSWAASKIIDIPCEDMFMKPRIYHDIEDDQSLLDFEKRLGIKQKTLNLCKSSRLYGTAFLVLVCDDDILTNPILPNAKLINVLNFSRFDSVILDYDKNFSSVNFLKPLIYQFNINRVGAIQVHYSRVIRVDNIPQLSLNNWRIGIQQNWGISEIVRCFSAVTNEKTISDAISTLVKEASIPILKAKGLQEALAGQVDAFESKDMSIEKFAENINDIKSIYSTVMLGENMSLERLGVSFTGLPEIFDRFNQQLAAVADIPMTRFFGQSAKGLNNGGDADLANYYSAISAMQQNILMPVYDQLDILIKNTLKIDYQYSFPSLIVQSAQEQSLTDFNNAQRDQIYLVNGVLSPEEIKANLYDSETYQSVNRELDDGSVIDIDNLKTMAAQ